MNPYDIMIIGAGPAGSHVAHRLSRLGYKVVVVDQKVQLSDDICCTSLVSQECFRAFAIDNSLLLGQAGWAKFFLQ